MYLDVVVTPNGEILLLDEDELKEAFDRFEVSKDDFENAYKDTYNLIERLSNNKDKLVEFTNKFLKLMIGDDK